MSYGAVAVGIISAAYRINNWVFVPWASLLMQLRLDYLGSLSLVAVLRITQEHSTFCQQVPNRGSKKEKFYRYLGLQ